MYERLWYDVLNRFLVVLGVCDLLLCYFSVLLDSVWSAVNGMCDMDCLFKLVTSEMCRCRSWSNVRATVLLARITLCTDQTIS